MIHQHDSVDDGETVMSILSNGTYCPDCNSYAPLYCRGDYLIYQDNIVIGGCYWGTAGCDVIWYESYAIFMCESCSWSELYTNYEDEISRHYCDTYHSFNDGDKNVCKGIDDKIKSIEKTCDLNNYLEVE